MSKDKRFKTSEELTMDELNALILGICKAAGEEDSETEMKLVDQAIEKLKDLPDVKKPVIVEPKPERVFLKERVM